MEVIPMKFKYRIPVWYSALGVSGGLGLLAVGWPLALLFVLFAAVILAVTGA